MANEPHRRKRKDENCQYREPRILTAVSRRPGRDRALPTVAVLFVGSGCAALIYEVVWFQLLQVVIGSSAISLGVLLGTFMGGMCLGSLLLPRLVDRSRHPLLVYAGLEVAIGVMGVLLLIGVPFLSDLYPKLGGHIAVRIVVACACLLLPTMAMGATLPAVARWVDTSRAGVAWLGWFYACNIGGGVAGTLIAGFYLLRVFDTAVATYVAAAINILVAAAAWALASRTRGEAALDVPSTGTLSRAEDSTPVYVAIALSGMTALSAQVIWTRLLSLNFGATVYTFSLILAAVLIGIGGGSGLGALVDRRRMVRPRVALGWCQLLLCPAIAWGAYLVTHVLPFWPVAEAVTTDPWLTFRVDLLRSLLVVVPAGVLWGASFPLALASVAAPGRDAGRLVGGLYAANTLGAIAGSLATSLFLTGVLGSQHVQQLLVGVSAVSGLSVLMSWLPAPQGGVRPVHWLAAAAAVVVSVPTVLPVPGALIAYGRRATEWAQTSRYADAGSIIYTGEGLHDFIAVSRGARGELLYHAAGKVQASTVAEDMRLQLLLAHFSHLIPDRAAKVLVIGCGAGITAGALSIGPGVEEITIAEIEPLVPQVAAAYFGDHNHHVIRDPRVSVRIDDGRHVLATTNESYDVITTDLIDPWVKGVAALFTREFFELAKRRLRPGGVVTQFVQLYQSSPEAVQSEIATFIDVFPNTVIWGNPHAGQGYDLVLLGQVDPLRIDVDRLQARLDSPAYARVTESLRTIGIRSAVNLLSTYAGNGTDLKPWLAGAAINRDRDLRLQYLAGLGLNLDENGPIYLDMLRYARYPASLFTGSAESVQALKTAIESGLPQ